MNPQLAAFKQLPEYLELDHYVRQNILTRDKLDILEKELADKHTSKKSFYSINSNTVTRALLRTATCLKWQRGMKGGGVTLLSAPDEIKFKNLVNEMANELNCITTAMARAVVYELNEYRLKFASRNFDLQIAQILLCA
ncbi:hypothetical protein TVAG_435110 [Trichomonas vaginalis G3]|uniref:Uncharacterized protein n=1 Tax=Trichomonas vaginalis (strain ATCC PRA-98 / G3) TaxID=412133 RepID=A2FXL0_TRIV3|nr:DDE endonuclease family [Trichomonas vaginalis G3]EAX90358.1 hypothetical protein TVAG_435110 [Trichomonas vaginalis G3]KAI5543966.1 DDE endonuclease family [Trichomonas vaginalis G3]|eukprot:XP_001303288.1 hypothetical protein [Trichomonas vaginalis G3]